MYCIMFILLHFRPGIIVVYSVVLLVAVLQISKPTETQQTSPSPQGTSETEMSKCGCFFVIKWMFLLPVCLWLCQLSALRFGMTRNRRLALLQN